MNIDHTVINMREDELIPTTEWYEKCLGFKRFGQLMINKSIQNIVH